RQPLRRRPGCGTNRRSNRADAGGRRASAELHLPERLDGRRSLSMVSTVIFRSTVIVMCDLAAVTAGAWILWNSSATSVVNGPVEDKLLFVLVVTLLLGVRHTVSRRAD